MLKTISSILIFVWVSTFAWVVFAQQENPAHTPIASSTMASSEEQMTKTPVSPSQPDKSMYYLAIAITIGVAAVAGTIAQGLVGSAAMNGVARNPGSKSAVQTLLVLTLVLIESIVIYALVVSLLLYAKL